MGSSLACGVPAAQVVLALRFTRFCSGFQVSEITMNEQEADQLPSSTELTTREAAQLLELETKKITPEQVAELARSRVFPGATKDDRGRWKIPSEDIALYLKAQQRGRQRRFSWITTGTIATLVTMLGIVSVTSDAMSIFSNYIFKRTPEAPTCSVLLTGDSIYHPVRTDPIFRMDLKEEDIVDILPSGTDIQVLRVVNSSGLLKGYIYFKISHYAYDAGPVVITQISKESPAQKAGLEVGDTLLEIDSTPIENFLVLWRHARKNEGRQSKLTIKRSDKQIAVNIDLRNGGKTLIFETLNEGKEPSIGIAVKGGSGKGSGGYIGGDWGLSCPVAPVIQP